MARFDCPVKCMQKIEAHNELNQKLKKFGICSKRYDGQLSSLVSAGFTKQQADKLIVRQSSTRSVLAILEKYNLLIKE